MYEIATICLDNFINTELSQVFNSSGYNFKIAYSISSAENLFKQKMLTTPDAAIIDCDNAGEQTADIIRFLKNMDELVKIIIIGDSSDPSSSKIFSHILSEDISRFYEKSSFLAEYMRDFENIKTEIDHDQELNMVRSEALRLRNSVLVNSLLGNYYTLDDPVFSKDCDFKDRLLTFDSYYIVVAGISIQSDYSENKSIFMLWSKILLGSATDYFNNEYDAIVSTRPDYRCVSIIIKAPDGDDRFFEEKLYNSCVDFVEYINNNSMFKINIGLSPCYSDLNKIHICFSKAHTALSYICTISDSEKAVVRWSDMSFPDTPDYSYMQKLKNNILASLMSKDMNVIENIINSSIDAVLDKRYRPNIIHSVIESIADSCFTVFEESIASYASDFQDAFGASGYAYKMSDIREIKKLIKLKIAPLLNSDPDETYQKSSSLVNKIKKSVENNYSRSDFTVEQIASDIFMNYSYICSAFKKETGSTINQYIKNYRMSHAVELIHTGSRSVPQIAEAVGFSDVSYFSKCFKQYFGVTPKTYIRQQL